MTSNRFFDTTATGEPTFFCIKKPYLYFDQHIVSGNAAGMKMAYFKIPETIEFYDQIPITSVTGTFQAGESIIGGSSGSTATIRMVSSTYLYVSSTTVTSIFPTGETITGVTSGATATTSGAMTYKVQTLSIGTEYKNMLAHAIAMMYFKMRGIIEEAMAFEDTLDSMIDLRQYTNLNGRRFRTTLR
jgi:hypothetical protein